MQAGANADLGLLWMNTKPRSAPSSLTHESSPGRRRGKHAAQALGEDGLDAAMRIRSRLVGADEGQRGLYLCHGFCEVGAYPLEPTLVEIRSFLVQHPGEVVLIIVEDYVTPEGIRVAPALKLLAGLV